MSNTGIIKTGDLRAKDQHVAERVELHGEVFLNVITEGTVTITDYPSQVWISVRGNGETTQIMLPITREQLCDLACGLWIEEMAEASDGQG